MLTALVDDRIFYGDAEQGTAYPYIVYFCRPGLPDRDSKDKYMTIPLQFLCYSDKTDDATEANNIGAALNNRFEDSEKAWSAAGWKINSIDKSLDLPALKAGDKWVYTLEYKISLTIK